MVSWHSDTDPNGLNLVRIIFGQTHCLLVNLHLSPQHYSNGDRMLGAWSPVGRKKRQCNYLGQDDISSEIYSILISTTSAINSFRIEGAWSKFGQSWCLLMSLKTLRREHVPVFCSDIAQFVHGEQKKWNPGV